MEIQFFTRGQPPTPSDVVWGKREQKPPQTRLIRHRNRRESYTIELNPLRKKPGFQYRLLLISNTPPVSEKGRAISQPSSPSVWWYSNGPWVLNPIPVRRLLHKIRSHTLHQYLHPRRTPTPCTTDFIFCTRHNLIPPECMQISHSFSIYLDQIYRRP